MVAKNKGPFIPKAAKKKTVSKPEEPQQPKVSISQVPLVAVQLEIRHDNGECTGLFTSNGVQLMSNPPQYQLVCSTCSEVITAQNNPNAIVWTRNGQPI